MLDFELFQLINQYVDLVRPRLVAIAMTSSIPRKRDWKANSKKAITDIKEAGIRCIQVTFNNDLEPFYKKCGFHIFKGGIIDFKFQ